MSENTSRDTQFRGFAESLLWGIRDLSWQPDEDMIQLIAQRAYDLACHVASQTLLTAHGDMSKIPDLTAWPEVQE